METEKYNKWVESKNQYLVQKPQIDFLGVCRKKNKSTRLLKIGWIVSLGIQSPLLFLMTFCGSVDIQSLSKNLYQALLLYVDQVGDYHFHLLFLDIAIAI